MVQGTATNITDNFSSPAVDINFVQTETLLNGSEIESDIMFEHVLPLEAIEGPIKEQDNLTENNGLSIIDNTESLIINNSDEVNIVSEDINTPDVNEDTLYEENKGYDNLNANDDSLQEDNNNTETIDKKDNYEKEDKKPDKSPDTKTDKNNDNTDDKREESTEENKKDETSKAGSVARTVDIPSYGGFKSYMSYKCFSSSSAQNKLQQSAVTESGTGLRMVDGRYTIAVGYGVSSKIGQYVDLVLENGTVIPCIVGDFKAKADTDASNIFSRCNCCSEFIVDMSTLDGTVRRMGDVSYMHSNWKSPVDKIIVYNTTH
jgi:hypothetical protein